MAPFFGVTMFALKERRRQIEEAKFSLRKWH